MDYWNSDGSIAEMCGNGVRVFVRYLLAKGLVTGAGEVPVATRAGLVLAAVDGDDIAVQMRRPRLFDVGAAAARRARPSPAPPLTCGNPHLVCALPTGWSWTGLDLTVAPGYDPVLFPAGVNVEFTAPADPVAGADRHVRMRVYERGSAETLSCGTGACAVAAVALRDAGLTTGVGRGRRPRWPADGHHLRRGVLAGRTGGPGRRRRDRPGGPHRLNTRSPPSARLNTRPGSA